MSGIATAIKGGSMNCLWPQFGGTQTKVRNGDAKPWSTRVKLLASAIQKAGLRYFAAQELGQTEAAQLAHELGGVWSYQRANLNCVFWRSDVFDYVKTRDTVLDAHGQWPGRSYVEVWLKDKKGNRLRVGSTHLTVKTAHDEAYQQEQIQKIVSFVNDEVDDWPLVIGIDTNNKQAAGHGMWSVLEKYGYTWDRSGIDAVLWNFGVKIPRVDRLELGAASDHDGRYFSLTTTKK
jgi:hypothetical protein